jgi:hypothetical protein
MFERKRGTLDDMKRQTEITAVSFSELLAATVASVKRLVCKLLQVRGTFIVVCNLLISIFTKLYIPAKFGFRVL